jgi:hypothetical protein
MLILVPVAVGTTITTFGLLSFGPVITSYAVGRWLLLSPLTRTLLAAFLPTGLIFGAAILCQLGRRHASRDHGFLPTVVGGVRRAAFGLRAWFVFLMPFYSLVRQYCLEHL